MIAAGEDSTRGVADDDGRVAGERSSRSDRALGVGWVFLLVASA